MTQILSYSVPLICPDCGTELSPALLSCPVCRRLVHGDRLAQLATAAKQASAAGDITGALTAWREALELLPRDSKQHAVVSATVSSLTRELDTRGPKPPLASPANAARPGGQPKTGGAKAAGAAGALAVLLWKLKFILVFVLTKAKLLLFGLTKAGTFYTMLLSIGVYWAAFGWKFAVGLVLSIYVHEMGHVAMLTRYGIKATAPMFIPGLGALIRLQQRIADPREDARVGLAGPIWGLGAAAVAYALHLGTGSPYFAAVAEWGGRLNLFNLTPVWQLDGSHAFRALTRWQRWLVVGVMAGMLVLSHEMILLLPLGLGLLRALGEPKNQEAGSGDTWTLNWFIALVIALSLLARVPVPGHPR